eukprot:jgi/Ulvmu1/10914/UM007_0091.1
MKTFRVISWLAACSQAVAQLSNPIADDSHISVDGNRFLERSADPARTKWPAVDDESHGQDCPFNIQLKWMAEATSSIYATPLITDLYADGYKDIIVPSFVHYLEVFQGDNGAQASGFPAFHADKVHASPMLFDIDHDGIQDIVIVTYNGQVRFYEDSGAPLETSLQVPSLPVDRDWYVGLAADNIDHSTPDVGEDEPDKQTVTEDLHGNQVRLDEARRRIEERMQKRMQKGKEQSEPGAGTGATPDPDAQAAGKQFQQQNPELYQDTGVHERQQEVAEPVPDPDKLAGEDTPGGGNPDAAGGSGGGEAADQVQGDGAEQAQGDGADLAQGDGADLGNTGRRMLEDVPTVEPDPENGGPSKEAMKAVENLEKAWPDMQERMAKLAAIRDAAKAAKKGVGEGSADTLGAAGGADAHGIGTAARGGWLDEDLQQFDDYYELHGLEYAEGWGEEEFRRMRDDPRAGGGTARALLLDAHVMCNAALGDLDGDGSDELVLPVSYFFDRAYYDAAEHRGELPPDVDASMYVASGIVVYDLPRRTLKWSTHLDMTTDHVDLRAYVYSAPTLADLNHDGKLEVIAATSVGFIYVLDSAGKLVPGWPVQMGEVQTQVAVADADGDGWLELYAADLRGSIAAFDCNGTLLWDVHMRTPVTQAPAFGDVNGDGRLDAVFGSAAGEVFALDAATGKMLDNFPFSTGGKILAPVTLSRLLDGPSLQLIVPSFDGYVYVIDGITACADAIDISDVAYASVLVDDLDGDGRLELLVATMSGHLYSLGTPAEHHPLKTWPQQVPGTSQFVARHGQVGVYAKSMTRQARDIRGSMFPVEFRIIDELDSPAAVAAAAAASPGTPTAEFKKPSAPYTVKIMLSNIDTASMNSGEQPVIGMQDTYAAPGSYAMFVPCPRSRATAVVRLEMIDANGIVYVDEFQQSFHMHFDRLLKWLAAGPLLAMGLFLLVLRPAQQFALPA